MIFLLLKNEILCSCRYMSSTICGVTGLKRHAPDLLKSKCKTRQQIFFFYMLRSFSKNFGNVNSSLAN